MASASAAFLSDRVVSCVRISPEVSSPGVAPAGSVSSVIGIELYVFSATTENIVRVFFKQPSECFFVGCLVFECHGSHGVLEAL